ncbi:MAG: hypothetical protein K8S87_00720 [Planctomycetes bacterium]|nr:hypothetical protein [Planctomycetota bacterium]
MSKEPNNEKNRQKERRRKEILAKLAGFCIKRNFKFDVISPKKWITLTFESRNEKQDQGIDIFIDVKTRDDVYFVIPAAYDVLFDEEIPAVLKAVNINNNFVNPARCSYSERSKKVIVDYTYPLIDGDVTLEQFSRILMFILESAEALRDNITKAQKKIDHFDGSNQKTEESDKKQTTNAAPLQKDNIVEKITNTRMYLSKLGAVLGEEIEETEEESDNKNNKLNDDEDVAAEDKSKYPDNEFDEDEEGETEENDESDEFEDTDFDDEDEYMEGFENDESDDDDYDYDSGKKFGYKLINFFDDVEKNMNEYDDDDDEEEVEENDDIDDNFDDDSGEEF